MCPGTDDACTPLRVGHRYVFGFGLPTLPDAGEPSIGRPDPVGDALGHQIAMLRALAEAGDRAGAIQLRVVVHEELLGQRRSKVLRLMLLGAAPDLARAVRLRSFLRAVAPPNLQLAELDHETLTAVLDANGTVDWKPGSLVEIRRALEPSDPEMETAGSSSPWTTSVLLGWEWTRANLVTALGSLHRMTPGTQLVIHVEPRPVSVGALGWLRNEVAAHRDALRDDVAANPLLVATVNTYRQRLRDLPRASLHLRVVLACPDGAPQGVAEVIGADLTRSWAAGGPVATFDLIRPSSQTELDCTVMLLQYLVSEPTQLPAVPELAELLFLFDPHEASAAFRIPVPGPEGLPGIRSTPTSHLPRGVSGSDGQAGLSLHLGTGASGESVGLTHDELNRHLLVTGLPGYGKTTTVQSILQQLWCPPDGAARVPFLVIDPVKADYAPLAASLGSDCTLVDLSTEHLAFNPLGCPEGVPVKVFATRVAAAFDAAYNLSEVYPAAATVLTRAVHKVADAGQPTLARLYAKVLELVNDSSYDGRTKGDLRAALVNRLELIADGSIGPALMGDEDAVINWGSLLERPAVIQLRGFTGTRERSLIFALLLAGLVSYREYHPCRGLGHVTVLEEAHRVLGHATTATGATEGALVFIDAMAELRGSGEGLVVVEQAPSRLAPEVRKLVGNVVTHRLIDAEERATVAASLVLEAAANDIARLRRGSAVVLAADMVSPTVVDVERPSGMPEISSAQPLTSSDSTTRTLAGAGGALRLWCQQCPFPCRGYHGAVAVVSDLHRNPGLSITDALDRLIVSTVDEPGAWCAAAFVAAQTAADTREWESRRQRLLAVRNGGPR